MSSPHDGFRAAGTRGWEGPCRGFIGAALARCGGWYHGPFGTRCLLAQPSALVQSGPGVVAHRDGRSAAPVDLERGEALGDRHQLDNVDVHMGRLAGGPVDGGRDVVGGQRLGPGVHAAGPLAVAEAHVGELGAADQARFDAGHPDSGAVQVGAEVEAELVHEGLGRAVDVAARIRVGAGDRAEVDDAPAAAGDHLRQERAGQVDQPGAVGLDHLVPLVDIGVLGGRQAEGQAGVVDQDVDRRELLRQRGRKPFDAGPVPDVEGHGQQQVGAELAGQGRKPLGAPRGGDDPVAAGGDPAGRGGAEAGTRPGDQYSPHGMRLANKRRASGVSLQVMPAPDCTIDSAMTLTDLLPDAPEPDAVFDAFAGWSKRRGLALYPHQEEALIEIVSGANVILSTPTGSGKSLVAAGAHFAALADGRRSFYTAPIKALVSEKFFDLCNAFGPAEIGMMTGDASVNPDAPIICCTAEVLASIALRDGAAADVGQVVMDEFHYYADPERGWAWQVPLIELPNVQFLLMSATLGDVSRFEEDLTLRTGRPTAVISSTERPVPLVFAFSLEPLHETLSELLSTNQAPVYVVHFTQAAAIEQAQALMSINVCSRAEKDAIADLIGGFRFSAGFGKTLSRLVRHGIGVHHAGMLPRYRRLVETLAQAGLLKVICGTDTLGVGINVPIRTVLFTALSKYDGTKTRLLQAREFHQIDGRAGRAGYDTAGRVVVQAPEHVVENERALAKAGDDPKARRKVVRKKPPPGLVSWGKPTFERLGAAEPRPLQSSFAGRHAMLLNVIGRPGDAFQAMRHLLTDNDESPAAQRRHIRRAFAIYRALLAGGVVERLDEPDEQGRRWRLTVDLQDDFALNQPLSPLALATIALLERAGPTYSLDVLSVIEATLDDPRQVLSAQQFRARGEAVAQMKADGIEYDERMELLESVSYPKPLADLLDGAYDIYRQGHPWVVDHQIAPKSVARDMFERAMTFIEYIGFYGLSRCEGVGLRHP